MTHLLLIMKVISLLLFFSHGNIAPGPFHNRKKELVKLEMVKLLQTRPPSWQNLPVNNFTSLKLSSSYCEYLQETKQYQSLVI